MNIRLKKSRIWQIPSERFMKRPVFSISRRGLEFLSSASPSGNSHEFASFPLGFSLDKVVWPWKSLAQLSLLISFGVEDLIET